MMSNLFVMGYGFSGKTAICLGLALKFGEEGLRVGYFKPVGRITAYIEGKPIDEDALLMKETLKLAHPLRDLCPFPVTDDFLGMLTPFSPAELLKRIKDAHERVSRDKDVVIHESSTNPELLLSYGLSGPELARAFGAPVLFVTRGGGDSIVDRALLGKLFCDKVGAPFMGIVMNDVPLQCMGKVKDAFVPLLREHGVDTLGTIPQNVRLTAPTVAEIFDVLGGQVLEGREFMDRSVENFLVGAMTHESALRYFQRSVNKAVITGGDRPDIALAALETSTSALILTGNLYPDVQVLRRASEKRVPVILVPYDTYTTVEKLDMVTGRIKPQDATKIKLARESVARYVDWKGVLERLGISA